MNASDLSQPAPGGAIPAPPGPDGINITAQPGQPAVPPQPPIATQGLSGQAAMQAAQKAQEAKNTEILAAQKGVQQILSRMPSMKEKLQQMSDLAPNTLYGPGVNPSSDSNDATGLQGTIANVMQDPKYGNTVTFKNLNDQLFVNEIPALMNGASGMRMDIPLVKGVKSASGVPLEANGQAKQQVIQTLNQNFDQTRDNALSYYKNLTGQDYDLGNAFQTPQAVADAFANKVISRAQATDLLRRYHGAQ